MIHGLRFEMSNSQRQDGSDQETTGSYSYPYGMDQSGQQPQIVMGVVPTQIAYGQGAYPGVQMVQSGAAPVPAPGQPTPSYTSAAVMGGQHQIAYQQVQHLHNQQAQQQQEHLQNFWTKQVNEIDDATDFRNHNLPLARIKKIMKADEDVKMISAEAPVVFAKACEMFILELTLRSWFHTEENRRRTLQKNDIAAAITRTDIFDFLVDIVPRDELKEEGLGLAGAAVPAGAGGSTESGPYYYQPQHGAPGMMMGQPVDQAAAAMYTVQQPHPMTYMPWPQPPAQAQNRQDQPNEQQGSIAAPDP